VTISAKTCLFCTIKFFKKYFHYMENDTQKFQPCGMSSVGVTALERRNNKEIDLYSDYTKNKLQALAFAAITFI